MQAATLDALASLLDSLIHAVRLDIRDDYNRGTPGAAEELEALERRVVAVREAFATEKRLLGEPPA